MENDQQQVAEEDMPESIRLIDTSFKKLAPSHELGSGAPCNNCADCPGLDLHFWRKICKNCKCGPQDHAFKMEDSHQAHVVKIRRLFGDDHKVSHKPQQMVIERTVSVEPSGKKDDPLTKTEQITFEWIPSGATATLAKKYMDMIPSEAQPIAGTKGAEVRSKQLIEQLPAHDQAAEFCDDLTSFEVEKLERFVQNYKDKALGVGQIKELRVVDPLAEGEVAHSQGVAEGTLGAGQGLGVDGQPLTSGVASGTAHSVSVGGAVGSQRALPSLGDLDHIKVDKEGKDRISKKKWICNGCEQPLKGGDVAVFAERAGHNSCWHPGCFRCTTCSQLLVDLIYFWKDDHIYCGRHYADLHRPRCAACDELIFAREYTQAEDRNWHLKHFCCFECDKPLGGNRYVPRDHHPYCLSCHDLKFAKVCMSCKKNIKAEDARLTHKQWQWHANPECFCCSNCGTVLLTKNFLPKEGRVFCSTNCKKSYFRPV